MKVIFLTILGYFFMFINPFLLETPKWVVLVKSADEMQQNTGFNLGLSCSPNHTFFLGKLG